MITLSLDHTVGSAAGNIFKFPNQVRISPSLPPPCLAACPLRSSPSISLAAFGVGRGSSRDAPAPLQLRCMGSWAHLGKEAVEVGGFLFPALSTPSSVPHQPRIRFRDRKSTHCCCCPSLSPVPHAVQLQQGRYSNRAPTTVGA